MNKLPEAILTRFPEYSKIIQERIRENEDFESLCLDYELCMEMIVALNKERATNNIKLDEYNHLKYELENEALKYLI